MLTIFRLMPWLRSGRGSFAKYGDTGVQLRHDDGSFDDVSFSLSAAVIVCCFLVVLQRTNERTTRGLL